MTYAKKMSALRAERRKLREKVKTATAADIFHFGGLLAKAEFEISKLRTSRGLKP